MDQELKQSEFIPVSQIQLGKLKQPRRYFQPEAIKKLTESIRQYGVLQPLLVRPVSGMKKRYELVAGERRFRAAQAAGLDTVPVVVRELSDTEAATLTLVENLQREGLNAIEETEGILHLLALHLDLTEEETTSLLIRMAKEVKGQSDQNVLGQAEITTVTSVFDSLGRMCWQSFVSSRLPLLNLPNDLVEAIQTQALHYTKAIALSRLKDDKKRSVLLQQVLEADLSVRQIQAQIKKLRQAEQTDAEDNAGIGGEKAEADGTQTVKTLPHETPTTAPESLSKSSNQVLPSIRLPPDSSGILDVVVTEIANNMRHITPHQLARAVEASADAGLSDAHLKNLIKAAMGRLRPEQLVEAIENTTDAELSDTHLKSLIKAAEQVLSKRH